MMRPLSIIPPVPARLRVPVGMALVAAAGPG
jgi:hypothetical protein